LFKFPTGAKEFSENRCLSELEKQVDTNLLTADPGTETKLHFRPIRMITMLVLEMCITVVYLRMLEADDFFLLSNMNYEKLQIALNYVFARWHGVSTIFFSVSMFLHASFHFIQTKV
jgi:hypothetical protein